MTQVQEQAVAPDRPAAAEEEALYALLAQYEDVGSVKAAAVALKERGYRYFEVHSPFPIHGLDAALDIHPTVLPWITLVGGIGGLVGGLFLTIWTMATSFDVPFQGYPFIVSGKPFNSLPAWIPVVFECTILLASLGTVIGMLLLNKLPLLSHPLLDNDRFRRATDDKFFITVLTKDQRFDRVGTAEELRSLGATAVEPIEE